MKIQMVGNKFMKEPMRFAGKYQIAYDVETPSGKTGSALFVYEYDKRDVVEDSIYTTEEIADEMREYIGDDSPCCFGVFSFPDESEENSNTERVDEVIKAVTVAICEYE